jgi:UBX domain/Ubiquitin interaction motif
MSVAIPEPARSSTLANAPSTDAAGGEDADLQSALQASLLSAQPPLASDTHTAEVDDELAQAIALSQRASTRDTPEADRSTADDEEEEEEKEEEEAELARALALSVAESSAAVATPQVPSSSDDELAAALALSMQPTAAQHSPTGPLSLSLCTTTSSSASLAAEPPLDQQSGVARIAVRLPSGDRITRRFLESATLNELYRFAELCGSLAPGSFSLYGPPANEFALALHGDRTLVELGFVPSLCLSARMHSS